MAAHRAGQRYQRTEGFDGALSLELPLVRSSPYRTGGSPCDSANDHEIARPAASQAGSTPPPRSARAAETSKNHNTGEAFRGSQSPNPLLIADGLFEVVPGILSGAGATTFDEIRLGKEVQKTSGGCL